MAENMNSGGGMTIDDFKELLKELGIGQSGKNAKVKVQVDTTQATQNVNELEEAFQKLWKGITNNKTKSKYFQSLDNATVDLKKSWNDLVSQIENDKKNGTFDIDKLYSTSGGSKQTNLLRYANAFEALGGSLEEINPQIHEFVEKMREAMKIANPNYQFTVEGFSEAFEKFEELRKVGVTIGNIDFNIGFSSVKQDVSELAELIMEDARNTQIVNDSISESYERQGQAAEEASEKIEKLTKAEMERKLKAEHEKDEYNMYGIDFDDELDDIQKYSKALSELKERQEDALNSATRYNNKVAEGDTTYEYADWMKMYIEEYHKYADQIEYVQERLQEAIRNYTPSAEGGNAKELNALVFILRDLHGEIVKISSAISTIGENNGLLSFSESIKEVGNVNNLLDGKQFQELIEVFEKMEFSLNSIKEVLVDVGDGEEFSPLLRMINNIKDSILKLNKSVSSIGLNMNIDFGSDKELETKYQEKVSNALQAYQRLFDHIKFSGAGGSIITQQFFDFDIDQYDTMMGKLQAYRKFIENMREDAKKNFNGNDVLYEDTDSKFWKSAYSYMGQLTKVINQTNASKDASPINELFGKTDLTEITSQLSLIASKLEEIVNITSDFKTIFSEGFNFSSSVEDIEKFNNRIKELEDELEKLKAFNIVVLQENQTGISSGDTAPAIRAQEELQEELKETNKEAKKSIEIPTDSFDEVFSKLDLTKSKLKEIVKITQQGHSGEDGKFVESFVLKDKDGSSETYGINSDTEKGQLLRYNYVEKVADATKELNKLSSESYQKELGLERERTNLLVKNLGATSDIIKANETRIAQIEEEIRLEQKRRTDEGLVDEQKQLSLEEEKLQLTKKLANAQEVYNTRRLEEQKIDNENSVKKISESLDKVLVNKKQFQYNDVYNEELKMLQAAIEEFNKKSSLDIVSQEDIDELTVLKERIEILFDTFKSHTRNFDFQLVDRQDIYKQMEDIEKTIHSNTAMPSSLKELFRSLEQEYKLVIDNYSIEGTVANVEGLNTRLAELKYRLQESGKTGNSVFSLIGKKIKGLSSNFIAMYLSLYDVARYIRQGTAIVKEYDDALTEMRKVSDETVSSLKEYQKATFDVADAVGTTATSLQKSTADFLRIGESMEQAAESAKIATMLMNVSEFESIDEATDSLVSMSAAFKELGKGEIVDVVNQLGNNFAISTDGLATALQNSASALKTAKNDFFEAAALTTAANTVVQDPDKVGAGLRTIALRLTGTEAAREELAEMGEDVDDFIVTTSSKMDQKIKDLTKTQNKMGVSLLDMNGNYRSTYEVLLDIAEVWETIAAEDLQTGENRQNALLEMMAGKNRSNILASILQSPDVLEEAYQSALGADGSAQKELDKYLDSISGKLAKFQNQLQELATTAIDSEFVKNIIDFGTTLLSLLTGLIDKAGVLGTLGGIGGIILGSKNVGKRRSTMFHNCFEYADRDKCFLY